MTAINSGNGILKYIYMFFLGLKIRTRGKRG